jgi:hypothetical protein
LKWPEAEAAIKAEIETQWALTAYTGLKLVWENIVEDYGDRYMAIDIEGTHSEKTIYGSVGKRSSIEGGLIYFHAFTPIGKAKALALNAVQAMADILELRTIGTNAEIKLEGSNPPSPVEQIPFDRVIPRAQPDGMYYRCSGSVPFILVGTR